MITTNEGGMPEDSCAVRTFLRSHFFRLLVLTWAAFMVTSIARAMTIEEAVEQNAYRMAALSPDGKHLATIGKQGHIIDVESFSAVGVPVTTVVRDGHFVSYPSARRLLWVTNEILAIDYGIAATAFDLKGNQLFDIGQSIVGKAEPGNPDSPLLFVLTNVESRALALVNAKTGEFTKIKLTVPGRPLHWAFDSRGVLRAITLSDSAFWKDNTTVSNWYRPRGQSTWEKLAEFKVTDDFWIPLSVPEEDNALVILSSAGRDTSAVFAYNTKTRQQGEMLAGHPTQDILHADGLDQNEFKSVLTNGMKPNWLWLERKWSIAQRTINATFPNHINVLSGDPAKLVLVFSYSDVDPGNWFLVDIEKRVVKKVLESKPRIDPKKMRPMEIMSYTAKDGLTIPAYLTRPENSTGPAPMVVLIHGGPWIRDHWGWDPEVQILASKGYAVFQPQFRGSSGFGTKFREAGYGQWGLAMQDDITTGVEHLVKQGVADPNRICIYGASYGGYAALWGLVKTPQLYRCGVSFAGVSDIEFMFNDSSDRNGDKETREIMRARVGDLKLGKAQFDSVSPLKHADRIVSPLLIAHGEKDERVPISHSKKMIEALKQHGKSYEWHSFPDEGHALRYVKSNVVFYEKVLAFLEKHIGPDKKQSIPQVETVAR